MSSKNVIAGRYEVLSHIGQGGMADVFLAVDKILNRQVAVKIMRADMSTDAVSILRFEREAQAAAALAHPNIVEIYDVGEYKGHHYIVMEYVVGQTLKKMIHNRGQLLNEEAVDIMKQLCSAIAEAHSRGIIHRDIKPQNVIVKADGTVKILDFGIATARGAIQLTQANNVMGSVHYLAPELAKGEPASPQSDIYALGIVFFEMLAGDVPFKADQAVQVAIKHIREPMPDIRKINPHVPQSIANIITRATAKLPRQRYHSCDEMLADVATCLSPNRLHEKELVIPLPTYKKPDRSNAKEPADLQIGPDIAQIQETREKPQKHHLKKILGISAAVLAGAAVVLTLLYMEIIPNSLFAETVPDLTGMSVDEAGALLESEHIRLDEDNINYALSEDKEEGTIIASDPSEGEKIGRNQSVSITVSSGIGAMGQSWVGQNIDSVKAQLEASYPSLKIQTNPVSSATSAGTILSQDGITDGELFDPDSTTVVFTYSAYTSVTIPEDIIGKPVQEATSELEALGIQVMLRILDTSQMSQTEIDAIQDKIGMVVDCNPAAGTNYTQRPGRAVTLYYY